MPALLDSSSGVFVECSLCKVSISAWREFYYLRSTSRFCCKEVKERVDSRAMSSHFSTPLTNLKWLWINCRIDRRKCYAVVPSCTSPNKQDFPALWNITTFAYELWLLELHHIYLTMLFDICTISAK